MRTSQLDEFRGKIEGGHTRPKGSQPPGGETITGGDIQDRLTGLRVKQTKDGRPLEQVDKVVSLAHSFIPEGSIGIPCLRVSSFN